MPSDINYFGHVIKRYAGEWFYGDLSREYGCIGISSSKHPVIPETVGQYTGLKDRNGVKIFEGDIVKFDLHCADKKVTLVADFNDYGFMFRYVAGKHTHTSFRFHDKAADLEIIGNIHDNPELLDKETT